MALSTHLWPCRKIVFNPARYFISRWVGRKEDAVDSITCSGLFYLVSLPMFSQTATEIQWQFNLTWVNVLGIICCCRIASAMYWPVEIFVLLIIKVSSQHKSSVSWAELSPAKYERIIWSAKISNGLKWVSTPIPWLPSRWCGGVSKTRLSS